MRNLTSHNRCLDALRNGKMVVFAGAGVSVEESTSLPSFKELALEIAQSTGKARSDDEPVDRFLGRLHHDGVDVHTRAAEHLSSGDPEPTSLHLDLLRLYSTADAVRIVTTNFDTLFDQAAEEVFGSKPAIFNAPALPLGSEFNGIVNIHGSIGRPADMVLTDSDFGRAYLTEGWARRFLIDLFRSYTVLFIGYSHDDSVMNFLARALPIQTERFVLTRDTDPNKWRFLGVEPVTDLSIILQ